MFSCNLPVKFRSNLTMRGVIDEKRYSSGTCNRLVLSTVGCGAKNEHCIRGEKSTHGANLPESWGNAWWSALQSQNTVSAYFTSKQTLPFGFARQWLTRYKANFVTTFVTKKSAGKRHPGRHRSSRRQPCEAGRVSHRPFRDITQALDPI